MKPNLTQNKKGQATVIVGTVVALIVGIILLIAVLVPTITSTVSTAGNTASYIGIGASGTQYNSSTFLGTNLLISNYLNTFVLIGALILIAGLAIYGYNKQ